MTEIETPKTSVLRAQFDRIFQGERCRDYQKQVAHNSTRMYRALSWLRRYEMCDSKTDAAERFLFLWISFDAAYGVHNVQTESRFEKFFQKIADCDGEHRLAGILLLPGNKTAVRSLIDNEHLYKEFWESPNTQRKHNIYEGKIFKAKQQVESLDYETLTTEQTKSVLCAVFARLHILRIQLVHGAATFGSSYNRSSLNPGNRILGACVPEILKIMLDELEKPGHLDMKDWGEIQYPPFRNKPDTGDEKPPKKGIS